MSLLEGAYCGQCGELCASGHHADCTRRAQSEPPRYCAECRRRMVVQVVPLGWSARCSRHGTASTAAVD